MPLSYYSSLLYIPSPYAPFYLCDSLVFPILPALLPCCAILPTCFIPWFSAWLSYNLHPSPVPHSHYLPFHVCCRGGFSHHCRLLPSMTLLCHAYLFPLLYILGHIPYYLPIFALHCTLLFYCMEQEHATTTPTPLSQHFSVLFLSILVNVFLHTLPCISCHT